MIKLEDFIQIFIMHLPKNLAKYTFFVGMLLRHIEYLQTATIFDIEPRLNILFRSTVVACISFRCSF